MAISYWKSFGLPITILRPFNTYGPRQSNRAVIPQIITQLANKNIKVKLGSTNPTRDFNFVKDTCSAFIETAKSINTIGEVINSCSNFEISIGETAELIAEVMNCEIDIESDRERIRPENSEDNRLFGSNEKIMKLTKWKHKYGGINGSKKD